MKGKTSGQKLYTVIDHKKIYMSKVKNKMKKIKIKIIILNTKKDYKYDYETNIKESGAIMTKLVFSLLKV